MDPGEIKNTVKRDKFIILYGNDLVDFYNKDQNYSMISHQLRILGDLVNTMNKEDETIKSLQDVLKKRMPLCLLRHLKKWQIIMFKLD